MFFNRGACPRPIVKPNFHSSSLNSSARYSFVEIGVSFCLRVVFGTISSSFLNWSLPHHPGVLPEKRPACAFLTYYLYSKKLPPKGNCNGLQPTTSGKPPKICRGDHQGRFELADRSAPHYHQFSCAWRSARGTRAYP